MTTWNYRAVKTEHTDGPTFCIHEVYYNDDGDITAWSVDPISPMGETASELASDIRDMLKAFAHPTLVIGELEASLNVGNNS